MLFSEPKIPQSERARSAAVVDCVFQCSSASRKFLNLLDQRRALQARGFQCSSASRKFLNQTPAQTQMRVRRVFQCSSASRKFLNRGFVSRAGYDMIGFSALQRAENSSISSCSGANARGSTVSVLFSEPKIPQSRKPHSRAARPAVSVLFSEPKIPQWSSGTAAHLVMRERFSALQRAENSSIIDNYQYISFGVRFQCSSASRKFLNLRAPVADEYKAEVSVLFSEPKIPQFQCSRQHLHHRLGFSALQRAENSSMICGALHGKREDEVSVLFSEPKIPQF